MDKQKVTTDKVKEFKRVLTLYIEKVQNEFDAKAKHGGTFALNAVYGDKYLSEKNYINLKGLYNFVRANRAFNGKQIEGLLMANASTFKFLNRYITLVPDAVDELRMRGCDVMAKIYKEQLKAEKVVEGIKKV